MICPQDDPGGSMTTNKHAIEWKNRLGRSKWQPVTSDGKREWLRPVDDMRGHPAFLPTWEHPRRAYGLQPRLYRIRLHASCVARRHDRREAARTWKEA